jgi:hypothetical protein
MSSFQKGHQYSNELAEVLLVSDAVDIDVASAGTLFPNQPFVSGTNYRILEVGFTANATTAVAGAGTTITIELVSGGAGGNDVITTQAIPALTGPNAATGVGGATVSTSQGGASTWVFTAGVGGVLDTDGVPRLLAGQSLRWLTGTHASNGWGYLWVRLAPEINRDVDV